MKNYPIKIYIAGKITGNPSYKLDFSIVKEMLKKDYPNAVILNPATLPEGMTAADYMRICLAMIDSADLVVFDQKAEKSKGARLEKQYCEYIEKPFVTLQHWPEFIFHCPQCGEKPKVGHQERNYFIIDSDKNCPVCGGFTKMTVSELGLINKWNVYAVICYAFERKKGDR